MTHMVEEHKRLLLLREAQACVHHTLSVVRDGRHCIISDNSSEANASFIRRIHTDAAGVTTVTGVGHGAGAAGGVIYAAE